MVSWNTKSFCTLENRKDKTTAKKKTVNVLDYSMAGTK